MTAAVAGSIGSGLSSPALRSGHSAAKAWLRAFERTASIAEHPDRLFPDLIDEFAAQMGDAPAAV